jgi:Sec-independent protein translocase protein TatA
MFEFNFGITEQIIVGTIVVLVFGHKKLFDVGKKLKRFVTE